MRSDRRPERPPSAPGGTPPSRSLATQRGRPVSRGTAALLATAVVALLVLRHDYWQWTTPHPVLFGLLPVGLWWQGLVSLLAAVVMWLLVRHAWPAHLEREILDAGRRAEREGRGQPGAPGGPRSGEGTP